MTSPQDLEALIDRTVSVPTIPAILSRLDRIIGSPDATTPEVAGAIEGDPALASKVLRIANSAVYGLKAQVSSLDLAVALLGLRVMRSVVLTASVLERFSDATRSLPLDPREFWRHSLRSAVAARMIHDRFLHGRSGSAEDAYISGLLHDLGKLVLMDGGDRGYFDLVRGARRDGVALVEREREALGFDHADVGSLLAERWNLPGMVVSAIRGHHDPERDTVEPRHAALAHLADYVAKTRGMPEGFSGGEEPFDPTALHLLGLRASDLSQMVFFFESEDQGLEFPFI